MKRKSTTTATDYLSMLSIEQVKSMDFETLTAHLRRESTLRVARPCIGEVVGECNPRIFLAAYMIAYKPNSVFEVMDDLAKALFDASGPMLSVFEGILNESRVKDAAFEAMTAEYFTRFNAWRVPDTEKLLNRIKHALVALYAAEKHLPDNEPADSPLKVSSCFELSGLG